MNKQMIQNETNEIFNKEGFCVEPEDIKVTETHEPIDNFKKKNTMERNGYFFTENFLKNKHICAKSIDGVTYVAQV